ncbi:MAG: hypothetical protein HYY02_04990 [Chloroflexi bacterium]|nr:hypothetical protein [Chloroflexota bacterium]
MKKLLVYLPDGLHQDLKELAHRKKTAMAELVRQAIEVAYQDELDGLLVEHEVDAHGSAPESSVSLTEYLARHGVLHR